MLRIVLLEALCGASLLNAVSGGLTDKRISEVAGVSPSLALETRAGALFDQVKLQLDVHTLWRSWRVPDVQRGGGRGAAPGARTACRRSIRSGQTPARRAHAVAFGARLRYPGGGGAGRRRGTRDLPAQTEDDAARAQGADGSAHAWSPSRSR